ncbi:hypothetical protein LV84_03372 [Algoriphagus ratkowskyi]|uniref:Uncharacterized protein n=1 Tax=Algoriphagus ratkowskyi TaxID=57028 RepID=A0A2W7SPZ2_9BACT|nr:hypothetical protein [Algoriphagus ratkowskyi]PZX52762.1 hypothetical protein LV84_03372 [Algoriphagus ratkowskyi]TXD76291.1 hypothetical protein ESW18_17075 [Algoriphagus ratkowskyi]
MNHWNDLLVLILIVSAIYMLIYFGYLGFTRYVKNKRINKKYIALIYKIRLFYKPIAWIVVIGGFVALDPLTHGFIILLVAGFVFKQLGNYVSGLFIRSSPLLAVDTVVKAGKMRGRINRIGSLGLVLITDQGERWVWYNSFDHTGFTLISNHTNVQQRALYLKSELSKEKLQNLIFDHPILVLGKPIILKALQNENTYLLHYTLVKGAQHEDFINFLQDHEVLINSTEKFDS